MKVNDESKNNFTENLANYLTHDKYRKLNLETVGHINIYNTSKLKTQLLKNNFKIIHFSYTNVKDYRYKARHFQSKKRFKNLFFLYYFLGSKFSRYFPSLSAFLLLDFAMVLAEKD